MQANKPMRYLDLSLYAFGGLGLEIVIMMLEGLIYGTNNFREWSLIQVIGHWVITCIVWGGMSYYLYQTSKKGGFDLFQFRELPKLKEALGVVGLMIICLIISYISWDNRFKVVGEWASKQEAYGSNGWIAYLFQYVYYWMESALVVLVIIFGQKFGEMQFDFKWSKRIPWGGILCGLSWGLVHALTKGNLVDGITACFCAVLFGIAYLLLRKNVRYAYPIIGLMFML